MNKFVFLAILSLFASCDQDLSEKEVGSVERKAAPVETKYPFSLVYTADDEAELRFDADANINFGRFHLIFSSGDNAAAAVKALKEAGVTAEMISLGLRYDVAGNTTNIGHIIAVKDEHTRKLLIPRE